MEEREGDTISERCAACGAALPVGTTCQDIFDECLMLEFSDPAYGKVHMLTVACFMIQHRRYSNEALAWIQPQLQDYFNGVPVHYIRQRAGKAADQTQRSWKVVRQPTDGPLQKVDWSLTIADLLPVLHDADEYCAQVERWARATLQEMPTA